MERQSARPIWSGSISFGLVTIPVRLFTAVREKRLHFRTLHHADKVPLKQKMVNPNSGKEVQREQMVKGYEIEKDRFVIIDDKDLEAAAPKSSKAIEIQDFVQLDEIDPLFFDKPYYVAPKPEGAKPYKLLVAAMEKTGMVGISKVVMWGKEYLAALRPLEGGLVLETMHFADEIVPADHIAAMEVKAKVDDRELKMAQQLIDTLSGPFKPEKYHDEYREQVMELIERKAAGEEIVSAPVTDEKPTGRAHNLMAALEASLAKSREDDGGRASRRGAVAPRARRSHHGQTTVTRARRRK
jgi:DNA end-binding protein Ku